MGKKDRPLAGTRAPNLNPKTGSGTRRPWLSKGERNEVKFDDKGKGSGGGVVEVGGEVDQSQLFSSPAPFRFELTLSSTFHLDRISTTRSARKRDPHIQNRLE